MSQAGLALKCSSGNIYKPKPADLRVHNAVRDTHLGLYHLHLWSLILMSENLQAGGQECLSVVY